MSAERAQGRGWVRIPASRGEQSATAMTAGHDRSPHPGQYPGGHPGQYPGPYPGQHSGQYPGPYAGPYATASAADQPTIYLSVVQRWREAGRTLPGQPDEEWERLISQPYWPGR
ncbi:hypothetical protein [Streptomyces yangpuensis]|uniref:hypothetical protein n=1 Tax=Streptomyces yangpuensis TaxID=1648182 RepID=UPI0006294C11|nr:hypothetical protein [Streptomyces yangpuensis]